jgi:hypothetical protein
MKSLFALFQNSLARAGFAGLVAVCVVVVGCGRSQGPVKKETDPAKIEQKRQQEAQQYDRERQPRK